MFIPVKKSEDRKENYGLLLEHLPYYINADEPFWTTLANAAAVIDYFLDDVNWVGFYLLEKDTLYLGPFQGLAACTRIKMGHGVCGQAALKQETMLIEDVAAFPGHITCDAASKSEIVVPLVKNGRLFGVLDVDSPSLNRFSSMDRVYLEKVAAILVDIL